MLLVCSAAAVASTPGAASAAEQTEPEVVLIGVAGLTWDDIGPQSTPSLWRMVEQGAPAATLSMFATTSSCDADGWLTVATGVPASARDGERCVNPTPVVSGRTAVMSHWDELARLQDASAFHPELGRLAAELDSDDVCVSAWGSGAASAAADADGLVPHYHADPTAGFAREQCRVALVDAGTVSRALTPERFDEVINSVVEDLTAGTTAIIFSVPNGRAPERSMGVAVEYHPGAPSTGPRYLSSPSTRWPGVVSLIDLPPTVFDLLEISPSTTWAGSPWASSEAKVDAAALPGVLAAVGDRDNSLRSVTWFFLGSSLLMGVALLLVSEVGSRRGGTWSRIASSSRLPSWLLAFPVASFSVGAVPWWRATWPIPTLYLAAFLLTVVIGELLRQLTRRRGATLTALVATSLLTLLILVDLISGQGVSRGSPLAPSPLSGGRFYGLSNATSASLAVAAVWCAVLLSAHAMKRYGRLAAIGVFGCVTGAVVLMTALPMAGADVGGALTLLPTFAVTGVYLFQLRVTWWRGAVIIAICVLLPLGVALADYARPEEQRTHLGRFIDLAVSGDAWELVSRKAGYAAGSLLSMLAVVSVLILALIGYRLFGMLRHRRLPDSWRGMQTSRAIGTAVLGSWLAMVAGSVLNDYGIRMATIGLILLIPLLLLTLPRVDAEPEATSSPEREPGQVAVEEASWPS